LVRAGKDAKKLTKAYMTHTPISVRRVSDLTDLLLETNLTTKGIKGLPLSKSTTGKFIADAAHFANEIKRRSTQVGAAGLIAQPELEQQQ